ncbi:MAG: hypothetical protein ACXWDS_06530 [Actinomycetota bacterium]
MRRTLTLSLLLAVLLAACGEEPVSGQAPGAGRPATWGEREPIVYSVVVAEVLDDIGSPPPVVYVVDAVCEEAGQVEPSELVCGPPIPRDGKTALTQLLERYAAVEYVDDAEAAVDEGGVVLDGGLLFWFGPLEDRKGDEVRVGATYASELTDDDALGVNLKLENQAGSWVVTGAAGLGGCPA